MGRMYQAAARLEIKAGKPEEAIKSLRKGAEALASQPGHTELLRALAEMLIQETKTETPGRRKEARSIMKGLRQEGYPPEPLDYLEARILAQDGKWLEAARILESFRPRLSSGELVRLARPTDALLGRCYQQLGDSDRQYAAYHRSATADPTDPTWVATHLGMASALLAMDRVDDALDEYRGLAAKMPEASLVV